MRRVRIKGRLDSIMGNQVAVYDIDTGELVEGITCLELALGATQENLVTLWINGLEQDIEQLEIDVVAKSQIEVTEQDGNPES